MNYEKIKKNDIANGLGVRVTIFVSGCPHKCEGCFNPETHDFYGGKPFTEKEEQKIMTELEKSYVNGLTLLGGEPMAIQNQRGLLGLVKKVKEQFPDKPIWCYTGYLWEELMAMDYPETKELLPCITYLVDGRFVESLKNPKLRFKGSSNQRIIDVPKSLQENKVVLWEEKDYI